MKRRVLVVGVAVFAAFLAAQTQAKPGGLVLRVEADFSTFDFPTSPTTVGAVGPFYVAGTICEDPTLGEACVPIGVFHCWGWIPPSGVGLVSQEFNLTGRGKIQTQGLEDEGPRAVVGGTGDFRNVRGEATSVDLSSFFATGEFVATFDLIGAKKGKNAKKGKKKK